MSINKLRQNDCVVVMCIERSRVRDCGSVSERRRSCMIIDAKSLVWLMHSIPRVL